MIQNLLQPLHHQFGIRVGTNIGENPAVRSHLVQHLQQLVQQAGFGYKGIADDAGAGDGIGFQLFKRGFAGQNFCRDGKHAHAKCLQ